MVQHLIEQGLQAHRAGRNMEAKVFYEQALAIQPRHPDALHLAGVAALQDGDTERAIARIQQAIEVQPGNPGFHANLAQAYLASQRIAEALAAFRRAAKLAPREPMFAVGAANCLAMQGSAAGAERELLAVTQRHPGFALAWYNLGNAVLDQERHPEAADHYRRAIGLDPANADAHNNLGRALRRLDRVEEAEQAYRQCLELQPDYTAGYCNLASLLIDCGRFAEAESACASGIARSHDTADLHLVLGTALFHQGKIIAALDALGTAARLAPDNARAAGGYGSALLQAGHDGGIEWLNRARKLQPESPDFRHAIAGACLSKGDLRAGWIDYDSRPARQRYLATAAGPPPARELPANLSGKLVCLLREQGIGDELFFLRFVTGLRSRAAEITCRVSPKLASMLGRNAGLGRIVADSGPLPAADIYMLLGDLPHAIGGSDCPAPLALEPLPEQIESMTRRLAALGPPPYLGLTWSGGTAPVDQRGADWSLHKRIPLQTLGTALREVNGTLLALQRLPKPGEIKALAACVARPVHDFTALNEDLEAMLALLALMDDYLGVSNANMHLRAAVGRTARVLVPRPAEWRWMTAGDASPWFPGFAIYRQQPSGSWDDAIERLRNDLIALFGRSAHTAP